MRRLSRPQDHQSNRNKSQGEARVVHGALALGVIATAIRLWLVWGPFRDPVHTENIRAGLALAAHGYIGDPFPTPTGPTAHVAPLYPALIGLSAWVMRDADLGLLVARSIVAVAFGAFIAGLPKVGRVLGFGPIPGLVTALLFTVPFPPVFVWIEGTGRHEAVMTMLSLTLLTCLTLESYRVAQLTNRRAAFLGTAWGVGLHVSPVLLMPFAALLVSSWLFFRLPLRRVISFGAVATSCLAVVVLPWTLRNLSVIGTTSLIRDNFGMELALSNNDAATADMDTNILPGGSMNRHPYFSKEEGEEMRSVGERRYYEQFGGEAMEWIRHHPLQFVKLTITRIGLFFLPLEGWRHHRVFYLPVLALGLWGLWRFSRIEYAMTLSLAASVAAYALPYFLVQSSARYSYPVLWIFTLFAAWGASERLQSLARPTPHQKA